MSDLRTAARQALEALEYKGNIWHMDCPLEAAITALKAALAQTEQQQEPEKRAQHAPEEPRSNSSNPPAVYKDEGIEAWYYARPRC
jgi:hypothetical protein